jgi:hypothetical protein
VYFAIRKSLIISRYDAPEKVRIVSAILMAGSTLPEFERTAIISSRVRSRSSTDRRAQNGEGVILNARVNSFSERTLSKVQNRCRLRRREPDLRVLWNHKIHCVRIARIKLPRHRDLSTYRPCFVEHKILCHYTGLCVRPYFDSCRIWYSSHFVPNGIP